jgi:regulatory protein
MRYKLKRFGNRNNILDLDNNINAVVELLREQKYLDDNDFAKWFADQRQEFKHVSKKRLRFELAKKNIDQDIIQTTLDAYDEELACRTLAHLKRHMKPEQCKQYLRRQGFIWDTISDVMEDSYTN